VNPWVAGLLEQIEADRRSVERAVANFANEALTAEIPALIDGLNTVGRSRPACDAYVASLADSVAYMLEAIVERLLRIATAVHRRDREAAEVLFRAATNLHGLVRECAEVWNQRLLTKGAA
jgi:hypothetical protein